MWLFSYFYVFINIFYIDFGWKTLQSGNPFYCNIAQTVTDVIQNAEDSNPNEKTLHKLYVKVTVHVKTCTAHKSTRVLIHSDK